MKLIVGLGNPDGKYKNTYHNIGFNVVDIFARSNDIEFNKSKCKAVFGVGNNFIVAKPQTYMNLSGDSVYELKKYFKVKLEDILIVLDDIDLPKGKIRYRLAGSAGTHNGLRDIVNKVGVTPRLKIGIGRDEKMDLADYVLSNVDEASKQILDKSYTEAINIIEKFIADDATEDITITVKN